MGDWFRLSLVCNSVLPAWAEEWVLTSGTSVDVAAADGGPDAGGAVVAGREVLRRWSLEEAFPLPVAGFGAIFKNPWVFFRWITTKSQRKIAQKTLDSTIKVTVGLIRGNYSDKSTIGVFKKHAKTL